MSAGNIQTRRVSMTYRQAERILVEINTARRLSRLEGGSHRMQNALDRVAAQMKRSIRFAGPQK